MNVEELLSEINNNLSKDNINNISLNTLNTLIIDTSRVLDKKVVFIINKIKKDLNTNFTSEEKNKIRLYLIGYPIQKYEYLNKYRFLIDQSNLKEGYNYIFKGMLKKHDMILHTIISRYKLNFLNINNNVTDNYIKYLKELQNNKNQLMYLNIDADDEISIDDIKYFIKNNYDNLSNYHNLIISFANTNKNEISWNDISKIAVYLENFLIEKNFNLFEKNNKNRRINTLNDFLKNNKNIINSEDLEKSVSKFYQGISYGFRFIDLFVSNDGQIKSLVMQKVQLDETPKRCPSCFEISRRGNSYPKLLFKSFECQNPDCPARSKSGRGKRFDLLSAKSQIMLKRNNEDDKINKYIYKNMRKDIVTPKILNIETMIQLYTWSGDNVLAVNLPYNNNSYKGRIINNSNINHENNQNIDYIPIKRLLIDIYTHIKINNNANNEKININKNTIIVNDNSNNIYYYKKNIDIKLTSAITSPPYYNAREYSQWKNFLCYLIDMMINAKAIFESLENKSTYIYNVGDIVDKDYIYIKSYMSKKRLMLGFYSNLIFSIVGFKLNDNIIWDKGEVQSKRNSSPNHFSGYLNPVNSYEHNLIFSKNSSKSPKNYNLDKVIKINPVKKINSKGNNTYGHTAPFPKEIARLILPFSDKNYIVDPFLGSGTTCIIANENNKKSIGFELNNEYFNLSKERINSKQLHLF